MRGILGIGNPGANYIRNRHNAGFLILDTFAESKSLDFRPAKGDYFLALGKLNEESYCLIKPTTYVNRSGQAALQVIKEYEIEMVDLLVVCDDVNLKTGELRIRESGGDGGHNGIASIIYDFNSDQFPRLRIGIGNDFDEGQLSSYVLSDFSDEEEKLLAGVIKNSLLLINEFIINGYEAMLDVNSRLKNDESTEKIN
ncbi:MAG: aminoacyl-tRNA hydrolase [Ignavibacterium sp.]|nr:MAG: aminoacyl-tRNA hydrolase [Ignavibacterium sp.]